MKRVSALVLDLEREVNKTMDDLRPEAPRIGRQSFRTHDRKRGRARPILAVLAVLEEEAKAGAPEHAYRRFCDKLVRAMDIVWRVNRPRHLSLVRGKAA